MINKINLAGVWVSDQDRAYNFFVNKVGFEVQSDVTMPNGYRWLEVKPPGAETALTLAKPYPGQQDANIGTFANVVFSTDDIQTTYKELAAKGVEFTEKPTKQEWGGIQALFTDPDGNTFVLVQLED